MSDFLVVAGQVIPIVSATETTERHGTTVRTADFSLRSAYTHEAKQVAATSALLTQAEVNTLNAATALGAHVACSGDALGGSVTCEVMVTEMAVVSVATDDGLGYMRTVSMVLRETNP
ncbi:MAG: hypothetical protein H0X64_13760 [Gemmatimonadaceae bacterium]|nr:hypothetical protein [Gemmatimonadaceae bacterium]